MGSLARTVRRHAKERHKQVYAAASRAAERCKPMLKLTGCTVRVIDRVHLGTRVEVYCLRGLPPGPRAEIVESQSTISKVWEERLIEAMKRLVERITVSEEKQS